jgi:catechol O-methyltransferase
MQDGREHVLHTYILGLPELAGRPEAIVAAIDSWSAKNEILMTIGAERGDLILDIITKDKPKVMVELGGYVGYSALKFGQALRDVGGHRYISLEANLEYAEIAQSMIKFAGLSGFVQIVVGPSSSTLADLALEDPSLRIDVLFVDHSGRLYEQDLKLAESCSLLSRNAVVIADNILDPNASSYLAKMDTDAWCADPGSPMADAARGAERFAYDSHILKFKLQSGEPV